MRITPILPLLVFLATGLTQATEQIGRHELKESESTPGYQPTNGLVPDQATAIAIAVAVWRPIYGKKKIADEAPYQATLKNDRWIQSSLIYC